MFWNKWEKNDVETMTRAYKIRGIRIILSEGEESQRRLALILDTRRPNFLQKVRREMVDGLRLDNGFIVTSWPRIIRFRWNLMRRCKFWYQEWSCDRNQDLANIICDTRPMRNAKWWYYFRSKLTLARCC